MRKILGSFLLLISLFTLAGCDDAVDNFNDITEESFLTDFVNNVDLDLMNYGIEDNVFFPTPINSDMVIVINSSNPELIDNTGHVSRPSESLGDQVVTVTIEYNYLEFSTTVNYQFQIMAIHEINNIDGLEEIDYFIGEEIPDYLYGVNYIDDEYGDLSLHIEYDDQYVNYRVEGTYFVSYYVENIDGYVTSNVRTINVELYFQGNDTEDTFYIVKQDGLYGIVNGDNTQVLQTKFEMIYGYENGYVILKQGDNNYIYNLDTKESLFVDYDVVSAFSGGVAKVKIDNKYGFINIHGELVISAIYDYSSFGNVGQIIVGVNNHYSIIDSAGNNLTTSDFQSIVFMKDKGTYITKKDGLKGVMDSSLDQIIENEYTYLYFQASTNTIRLTQDNLFGVADHEGNILCEVVYDSIVTSENGKYLLLYHDGVFNLYDIRSKVLGDIDYYKYDKIAYNLYTLDENQTGTYQTLVNKDFNVLADEVTAIFDEDNNMYYRVEINYIESRLFDIYGETILSDNYSYISPVYGGFRYVRNNLGKYQYISEDFTIESGFLYEGTGGFSNGFAKIRYELNGLSYLIDTTFTQIGVGYEYINIPDDAGNAVGVNGGLVYLIDSEGNILNDNDYKYISSPLEGIYLVRGTDYLFGYMNVLGEEIVPTIYKNANMFKNGFAVVQNDENLYGYIDTSGTLITDMIYTYAASFKNERAVVTNDAYLSGYIDEDGNEVIDLVYDRAYDFYNDYAIVRNANDGLYYSISKNGIRRNFTGFDELENYVKGYSNFSSDGDYVGSFDEDLNVVVPEEFETIIPISDKLVKVHTIQDSLRYSIYNIETQTISESIYYQIGTMNYDMACVETVEGVTFINDNGEVIFDKYLSDMVNPFEKFEQVTYQNKSMYLYRMNSNEIKLLELYHRIGDYEIYRFVDEDQYMIFDSNFIEVDGVIYDSIIRSLNAEFFTVTIGNNTGVINRDLEVVIPIMFDEVYVDDYSEVFTASIGIYTSIYNFNGEIMVGLEYQQIQIINK